MNTRNTRAWKVVSALVVSTMLILTSLFAAPAPVALAANTGYRSPTADYVYATGFANPNRAYANDANYAYRNNNANGVAHVYRNYGFSIPAGAVIQGIQVRLDWWLDSTFGTNAIRVYLSWNGGSSWTPYQSATTERTSDGNPTDVVGGTANTWGRTWSASEFSNANFRVRLELRTTSNQRDFRIDWVPVQVTYNQSPNAPTNQTPVSGAFTAAANPQFTWSAFSDPDPGDTQTSFQVQLRTQAGTYGGAGSRDSGTVASAANTYTPATWNLGDGTYCWHVRVRDNSGATNSWSGYSTDTCFTVDRTAPASAATSPDYDNSGPIPVGWTASDNAGGSGVSSVALWYRLDAGAWTNSGLSQSGSAGTFDFNPPGGTNGTYYFQTIATDNVGNVEAGPAGDGDDSTVYDTTPPTSQATPPAGPINAPPIAIPWTADGAVSGIATNGILLRYNFSGGAYADGPTASGTSGTFNFNPPSGGGTYCFYTIATDNAGNVEAPPGGPNGDGCTIFNTPPVAVNDVYSTPEDTPLTVAAPGVLGNDTDADGNPLTAVLDDDPASGTLVFNANGSFVYTPTLHFNGVVTFTYHANDGTTDSNVATVTITVTPVNDAPTFTSTPVTAATEDVAYTYNITTADPDLVHGDTLAITAPTRPGWLTLTDNGDGTATLSGMPTNSEVGDHDVVLRVTDSEGAFAEQPFTITVANVNDAPTFTSTPVTAATQDVPYTYAIATADPDLIHGDTLVITAPTLPAWLTLTDNGDGTATLAGTPTNAEVGDHDIVLRVTDGEGAFAEQAFAITVANVNDAPVAVDDGYRTLKNTPLIATQGNVAVPGVLDNDSDPDGDPLTAILDDDPASGTLALDADGSFVYTPTLNFIGVVTFTYHANDSSADSNIATATITVTEFNYPPVAVNDIYSTAEDTALTVPALQGVLTNDSDPDHDPLTAVLDAGPASGTLVLSANGSFVYTPTLHFNGVVTFTYHASDGTANSNVATVTITVTPVNDAPAFTSTPVTSATENAAYRYDVTATDVDNALVDLTITAPTRPGWLTLTDNGDGTATLTGTPTHADIGDHPVVLQVSDGAATTTQSFTITVNAKAMCYIYLPVLFRNHVVAPDLVVQSLTATSSSVQMVIANQGNAPVTDEFWVDAYIDPHPVPTAVNQIWPDYASQGLVWGITAGALPLAPGETLTLTIGDAYYSPGDSSFSGSLAEGTPVYAQVDSANFNTTYGGVLEDHEILGGAYNNIASTLSTAGGTGAALPRTARAPVLEGLPPRK